MIEAHKRVILERLNTCPESMGMMMGSALGIGDGTGNTVEDGDPLVGGGDLLVRDNDPSVRDGDPLVRDSDPSVRDGDLPCFL